MQVDYKFTEEDQRKYLSTNFNNNPKFKIIPILAIILLSVSLILSFTLDDFFYTIVLLAILFLVIFFYYINPRIIKNKYIKNLKSSGVLDENKTIEVSEYELKISSQSRTTAYQYSDITSISIINDYFIHVNFSLGDSIIVPKTAFSTNTEMIDFINKIKSNAKII